MIFTHKINTIDRLYKFQSIENPFIPKLWNRRYKKKAPIKIKFIKEENFQRF